MCYWLEFTYSFAELMIRAVWSCLWFIILIITLRVRSEALIRMATKCSSLKRRPKLTCLPWWRIEGFARRKEDNEKTKRKKKQRKRFDTFDSMISGVGIVSNCVSLELSRGEKNLFCRKVEKNVVTIKLLSKQTL